MRVIHNLYPKLITKENIFCGWKEFLVDKKRKKDVLLFMSKIQANLDYIHTILNEKNYQPGNYTQFYVRDPKLRLIHKATVLDRVMHHIVSRELEPIFEPVFYAHSYSCRKNKGTHKGVTALQKIARKASRNNKITCWALKCDIKKFFASVNHKTLFAILGRKIKDRDFLDLLWRIIDGFCSDGTTDHSNKKGIPIGNLTSQFFSNIYMNELDQFVKHKLKVKYYIRYADDFVILSGDKEYLESLIAPIGQFLNKQLDLELHPQKISFTKFRSGIDFLGYVIFPYHILPRVKTKKRMLRKIKLKIEEFKTGQISEERMNQTIQSYLGYLGHANTHKFRKELENQIWFWLTE